jgi:hypothetical protein
MGLPSWTDHAAGSRWCSWVNRAILPSRVIKTLRDSQDTRTLRTPGLLGHQDSKETRTLSINPDSGDTRTLSTPGLSGHQDSLATRTVWVQPHSRGHQDSEYTRTLEKQDSECTRTLRRPGCWGYQDSQLARTRNAPELSGFCDHHFLSVVDTGLHIN